MALALTKSFAAWLVSHVVSLFYTPQGLKIKKTMRHKTRANDFVNAEGHAREKLCSQGKNAFKMPENCFTNNFSVYRGLNFCVLQSNQVKRSRRW